MSCTGNMKIIWQDKRKLTLLAIFVLVGILLVLYVFPNLSQEKMKTYLENLGPWAGPIYVLLFAILPGFFFPTFLLVVPAGLIFGFVRGTILTLLGAAINMAWMFLLARYLFHDQVEEFLSHKLSPDRLNKIQQHSRGFRAFQYLLILRVTPLIPYNLLNYVYGLSSVDFKTYMLGSILGVAPGAMVYLNLGDKIWQPGSVEFWIALSLFIVLILASHLLAIIFKPDDPDKNQKPKADQAEFSGGNRDEST